MSFANIVGNEPAVRLLKGQLTRDRVAHAVLLVGPRGIGKRTLALEFAKALQCESGGQEACESCPTCRQIVQGTYPDLRSVAAESQAGQMGIDQIRGLAGWLSLTPYQSRWKIGLIDGADRLTEEAAHAFLKLLEEPPEKSLLLLTASGIQRLPPTLVSRCHRVRCVPQGIDRVRLFLQNQESVDPGLSQMLAAWSGGRLGLALEFYRKERLATKNGVLNQLLTACRQKRPEVPLGTAPREDLEEALEWLAAWWRDLLVLQLGGDSAWAIHQDRLEELNRQSSSSALLRSSEGAEERIVLFCASAKLRRSGGENRQSMDDLLELIDQTYWVQEAIQRNASPRIALSALFCRS